MNKTIMYGIISLMLISLVMAQPNTTAMCIDQSSIARDNTRQPITTITFPYGLISQDASVFYSTVYHYDNLILNLGDIYSASVCWSDGLCLSHDDVQWIHDQRK